MANVFSSLVCLLRKLKKKCTGLDFCLNFDKQQHFEDFPLASAGQGYLYTPPFVLWEIRQDQAGRVPARQDRSHLHSLQNQLPILLESLCPRSGYLNCTLGAAPISDHAAIIQALGTYQRCPHTDSSMCLRSQGQLYLSVTCLSCFKSNITL